MAKSMRSKRVKRLRAIRRDMVEPFYDNKDAAKLAAQEAALSAPKLPPRASSSSTTTTTTAAMDLVTTNITISSANAMDMEMADGNESMGSLKPVGGIGKKSKRKFKVGKSKRRGKGIRRKSHI
ncbi:uncharacterized protein LOC112039324 [Quercus suber]|uniref:Uncharacterized protein n=1 Tax=Quercus suber TaxID=58331 RepID=A0AAW0KBD6_QUESU|nr:uncharacterized protein LOC112039324 [Quercus suber]POF24366.1 hypothetical protein CFP56_35344 [Quercus suber]